MRVAHICPRLRFRGGTERFVSEVNLAMKGLGVRSAVYSSDLNLRPALVSDVALSTMLATRAVRDGFNALVFHQGQAASRLFRGVRTISYFHQIKYDDLAGKNIIRSAYRCFLASLEQGLTQAVCNSEYAAARIRNILPDVTTKVVYPGIRIPTCSTKDIGGQDFCYCHSRLHPLKNQSFLLTVFEGLRSNLWITGGTWDRRFTHYQQNLIGKASQMQNVRVSPNIDEIGHHRLLFSSILFCFPARTESFGIALLEAMAFGKPIIALDSGASPEVLGGAGILCSPEVLDWRTAITDVLCDFSLRSSLGSKSLLRANTFSWERTASQLLGIIETGG